MLTETDNMNVQKIGQRRWNKPKDDNEVDMFQSSEGERHLRDKRTPVSHPSHVNDITEFGTPSQNDCASFRMRISTSIW